MGQTNLQIINKEKCLTEQQINLAHGSIKENNDGTVSVYMPSGPVLLSKICCESLKPNYIFDIENQKCKWANSNFCNIENPIKITLNTDGVDGSLFFVEENDNCYLDINFDYLFKFNCEDIINITNIENSNQIEIINLTNQINNQLAICEGLNNQITELENQINNTSYSITCITSTPTLNEWVSYPISVDIIRPFKKNGFIPFGWNWGGAQFNDLIINPRPVYFEETSTSVTYCLTEPKGLFAWSQILGNRYQNFLNGDSTSYTCKDVNQLVALQELENDNSYFAPCSTPFGSKTKLIEELNYLQEQAVACENELASLNEKLTTIINTNNANVCGKTTSIFENLDVSMLIDVISGNTLVTVSEIPLFSKIGVNNLYDYLKTTTNSGFYVCGVPSDGNTSITACTPLIMSSFLSSNLVSNLVNTNICGNIEDNLENSLFLQTGLIDNTTNRNSFNHSLYNSVFASNWRSFSGIVDDENVLSLIRNKKIKISFKINSHCGDFCLLVDKIKLNKSCVVVNEEKITISKSPGFELEKVHDNKKSWVKNATFENRPFYISSNIDTNIIRETNYNVLDERLVINTKEIDLDISIASAIETDVWCYVVENPCLLTGITCFSGYSCPVGYSLTNNNESCIKLSVTDVTESLTIYTAVTATTISSYNNFGALFYSNINNFILPIGDNGNSGPLKDNNGLGINVTIDKQVVNTLWGSAPATSPIKGRLNNIGVWSSALGTPENEWIGFTKSLNLTTGDIYSIGICGDNYVRIKLNGSIIVNIDEWSSNFNYWHVFPVTLNSGLNIIELEGKNESINGAFGCEIYSTTPQILSGLTTILELEPYIVFSSKDNVGKIFNLGENSGYSCPSGFAVNIDGDTINCIKIEREIPTGCCASGNCGDNNVNLVGLMSQSVSNTSTIDEFISLITSELIDAKSRKTLSSYPTLRALYDRYLNSINYCGGESSSFDYITMENFSNLLGDYWIDLVEQVVPATTIWGSAKIYGNTIFDQQKFQYKKYSLFTCINACNENIKYIYSLNDEIYCILKKYYLPNFNVEEFNCEMPSSWSYYDNKINNLHLSYVKCFKGTYYPAIMNMKNTECRNDILVLYDNWNTNLNLDFINKRVALFSALSTSTFIESLYSDYLEALNKIKEASDEIMLLLNNNCQILDFNNKIDVDLTTITSTNKKVSKCEGVYIKQMDAGSEFIGKIYYYNRS